MMPRNLNSEVTMPEGIAAEVRKVARRLGAMGSRSFVNRELAAPSTYLLRKRGKMLRPALVFLGAEFVGADSLGKYTGLAASIELLHTSSLVHDDMIDKDMRRRGSKATHVRFGMEGALLGGDALISMAVQEANAYGGRVVGAISEAAMKMCAGEMLDYGYQNARMLPGLFEYIKVAELKSSVLIGLSASVVALHRSDRRAGRLYEMGIKLGTAFQIRDDVMDFYQKGERGGGMKASRLNVVGCIMEEDGIGRKEAVAKAAALNAGYVDDAVAMLGYGANAKHLIEYASKIKLHLWE